MDFDIFFSISRTPVDGFLPTEAQMFRAFFEQVEAADALGFGTAWIAESHLSSEVQKRHPHPVIPFWQGEVGLNADIVQMAHAVFRRTRRIEVGSAVMGLFVNGGPVAHAERIAQFLAIHGLDPEERRKLNIGFAAGRFDFQSRVHGMKPRNAMEQAAWPALKGKAFAEAAEIFCRLVRGDELSSDDVRETELSRGDFRSDADWRKVLDAHGADVSSISVPRRYEFDVLKIVPEDVRKELLELYVGSHDARLQEELNAILPVRVFNLSITKPEVIEDTHRRMAAKFHAAGGAWRRRDMPRTVFVFLNAEAGLSKERQREAAGEEARAALSAYWTALEGTLDPKKVEGASENALVGTPEDVAGQILERFHPEDRLMLWFDFFNHDSARVVRNMEAFMKEVVPLLPSGR